MHETQLSGFRKFAAREDDSPDTSASKTLIFIVATTCCICGLAWGLMYYIVFGSGLTMVLPWIFTAAVGIAIFISHGLKDHRPLIYMQLFCITWISALIQWSIGSMDNSGLVIAWSFLGPLGALIFLNLRQAIVWMLMFVGILVVSAVFEPTLLGKTLEVSPQVKNVFYIMNVGASSVVVFAALAWFVGSMRFEKGRAESLLVKIRTLFGQHVSTEVASNLISKEGQDSLSKACDVTIMFLDIRDFSVFADARDPQEVANFQNIVFSELIEFTRQHRGIVNQMLGDGIMAIFGAPLENETHIDDAIEAGRIMLENIRGLGESNKIPPIKVGIGLHTGKVVAGELGNEFRKAYSVTGTNVNIAARIESLNKALSTQFLISSAVYERMNNREAKTKFHGEHELKGIAKPIGIYELS